MSAHSVLDAAYARRQARLRRAQRARVWRVFGDLLLLALVVGLLCWVGVTARAGVL